MPSRIISNSGLYAKSTTGADFPIITGHDVDTTPVGSADVKSRRRRRRRRKLRELGGYATARHERAGGGEVSSIE